MATKCPKCQSDNTDTARFCSNCAMALTPAGQPPPVLTKTLKSPVHVLAKGSLIAGKYRVLEEIGRGGMGVVYEAEDTKLARKVAIKVLPEIFTADSERLARFEREARVLASLNHPNIAAIHGVEEAEGKRFLVLELVEGETLAERLVRGPLSLEETIDVCRQIAEGLEGAHEKGIIHRDLKPSNVKIAPEGKVKILDFGLARAFHDQISEIDLAKSPTITADMTQPGVILGTAAYMSPEQAKGRPADKRADIWAFGCILFECLAGKRAFRGETITETLAAILKGEPDWQALPAATPRKVKDLLKRCLQRDAKYRWHDIADARIEIEESLAQPEELRIVSRRFPFRWIIAGSAIILAAGILIGYALRRHPRPAISFSVVGTIKVEPGYQLDGIRWQQRPTRTGMVISSDGRFIVYSAVSENPGQASKPQLYLRRMNQSESKPISGTEGGIAPFLSPDDRWVGFWVDGRLKKVSIDGGVPVTLCDASAPFGASWGSDNSIVFCAGMGAGLSRVSAEGGKPEVLTTPDGTRGEYSHRLPHYLPTGKGILFTIMRDYLDAHPRIAALDIETRQWHELLDDAADACFAVTGHLVFLRQGTLMLVPFDLDRLKVTGQPVPAIDNVMQALNIPNISYHTAAGQFSLSDSGWLIYASGGLVPDEENTLMWVDQKGNAQPVTSHVAPFFSPRISPDGRQIAYSTRGKAWRVWVYNLNRDTLSLLTGEDRAVYNTWTPDSRRLIFAWWRSGPYNLCWQPADGSSSMERLTTSEYWQRPGSLAADGKTLAFVETHPDTNQDIYLFDFQQRQTKSFLNTRFEERYPEFSPDGRWMAYTSDVSQRQEVYVCSFPGREKTVKISQDGGAEPLWGRNAKQLFYRWQSQVWAVDVRTEGDLNPSKPRLLFEQPGFDWSNFVRNWDISLDSQRFLMVRTGEMKPLPVTEIILVQNWFEELKRLVPRGKK